jgi:hypothetical protein
VDELAAGLWRWTAPHHAWRPDPEPESTGDWDRDVGSVLYLTPREAFFIDPLLPPDSDTFWRWADDHVADRRVAVITTLRPHRRNREAFIARYGASRSRARGNLLPRVVPIPISGACETMFWLPELRALIPGDRLLGAPDGGLRLCPESWLYYIRPTLDLPGLSARLRPLLELPIELVVVSHGEPVLVGGRQAIERALVDR